MPRRGLTSERPRHIERELRAFLECGILACGFARARCGNCSHDFLVAFSCKSRRVCPSCSARRMAATAAHLVPGDVAAWRDRIRPFAAEGRKTVIWGAGSKAVSLLTTCGLDREVEYLVDVNPHKAGKFLPGTAHAVVEPEFLRQYQPGVVVAMNPVYVGEIRDRLAALNVTADVIAL